MTKTLAVAASPALRLLLWAFAATSAAVLGAILLAAPASASEPRETEAPTPVADLLSEVTSGSTDDLTDALAPVTAPVEAVTDQVTKPLRAAQAPAASAPAPERDVAQGSTASPADRTSTPADGNATNGAGTRSADDAALLAAPPAEAVASADAQGASTARDVSGLADQGTGVSRAQGESVDVADLDFGPRPATMDDHQATAAASAASSVAADAFDHTARLSRDDLLLEVRTPHDTGASTQNYTRPDVSPG